MRICHHPTCSEPATVFYRHPYCGKHALERYGFTPALESRFAELHRLGEVAASAAAPAGSEVRVTTRPPASGPAPLSDGDLERLLATNGWDLMDVEWAWVDALEDKPWRS